MTDTRTAQPLTPEEALAAIRDTSPDVYDAEEGNYCFWCTAPWKYGTRGETAHAADCIYLRAMTPAIAGAEPAEETR